jgi:DNA invertase Pin-like site-specific DNA recombinase
VRLEGAARLAAARAVACGEACPWETMGVPPGLVPEETARRAVAMILLGEGQRKVARACGLHRLTVKRWAERLAPPS